MRASTPLLIAGGLIMTAAGFLIPVALVPMFGARLLIAAWLVLWFLSFLLIVMFMLIDWASWRRRPARFRISSHSFVAPSQVTPWPAFALVVPWFAFLAGGAIQAGTVFGLAIVAVLGIMVTFSLLTWRGYGLELTPNGITERASGFRRTIPWVALAPGGPLRPAGFPYRLDLAVLRPDLVSQRGWSLGSLGHGSRQRPRLDIQLHVHPWFLADAIRWYAEHPEHRAGIGTPVEHARLLAAITSR